jgi:hypothetical protein
MKAYHRILPLAFVGIFATSVGMTKEQVRKTQQAPTTKSSQPSALSLDQVPDQEIYGYFYMTGHDRDLYRQRLREAKTAQERAQFLAEHKERMRERAKAYGVTLPAPSTLPAAPSFASGSGK